VALEARDPLPTGKIKENVKPFQANGRVQSVQNRRLQLLNEKNLKKSSAQGNGGGEGWGLPAQEEGRATLGPVGERKERRGQRIA